MKKQTIYTALKWTLAILAYAYLIYRLLIFKDYDLVFEQWNVVASERYFWLLIALLLLPINLGLEALKWKVLTKKTVQLPMSVAIKSVLAGICSGFFTPNRIGDMVGRISYFPPSEQKAGITLSIVNSLTQNIVVLLYGIPAAIAFFFYVSSGLEQAISWSLLSLAVLLLFLLLFYFQLPRISNHGRLKKIRRFTDCITTYSTSDLLLIIFLSLLRYIVFSSQFLFVLYFFGVELMLWQATIAILAYYLFVTFTPAFAFSEIAIRGSYAVFFVGAFSTNTIGIVTAGVTIWIINTIAPMIIGSVFLLSNNKKIPLHK